MPLNGELESALCADLVKASFYYLHTVPIYTRLELANLLADYAYTATERKQCLHAERVDWWLQEVDTHYLMPPQPYSEALYTTVLRPTPLELFYRPGHEVPRARPAEEDAMVM